MKSEANLVVEVWTLIREHVPPARRSELAISFLRQFEEYGFEQDDLSDILDEDDNLTNAYRMVFGHEADDDMAETEFDVFEEF